MGLVQARFRFLVRACFRLWSGLVQALLRLETSSGMVQVLLRLETSSGLVQVWLRGLVQAGFSFGSGLVEAYVKLCSSFA